MVEFKALNEKERRERIMAKSTLLVAFEKIRDEFNACSKGGDYTDKLTHLFHRDVIISKVDDSTPVQGRTAFAGVGDVIQYLEATQAQTNKFPKFNQSTKKGEETPEETPPDSSNSTLAQVSGIATYKDTKDTPDGLRVRYFFTFTRAKPGDPWLLINASTPKVA